MPLLLVKIMWKLTWRWYTMCTACHNRDRHTHRGQYEVKHGVGSLFVKSDSPNNSVTVHWRYYEIHKHHHVRHRLTMYLYWRYYGIHKHHHVRHRLTMYLYWRYYEIHKHHHVIHRLTMYLYWRYYGIHKHHHVRHRLTMYLYWRYYEIHKHHHVRHRLTMYLYWLYPHKTLPSHNPFDTLYIIVMKGVSVYNYSDTPQGNSKLIANNNAHEPTCTPLPCIVNTCAFVLKWGWLFIPITNIL